jgi:hypothetical protein
LLLELSFPLFKCFFPLNVVKLLQSLLGLTDFILLVNFYFLEDSFIFVLSAEEKTLDYLFEDVHIFYLIALAASKTECVVEEQLEGFFLVLENLGSL